jgi:2-methylisocitrate lyase-like PEP mutase family enzyme
LNPEETIVKQQQPNSGVFSSLHVKGSPLILFNIWDPGSAKAVAASGAKAVATGSASVAMAFGFGDGEKVPLPLVLENAARIVASIDLPVTLDFEGAYATTENEVAENTQRAVNTGVVGFNFEDQILGDQGLHETSVQAKRIEAMRSAADRSGVHCFVNARTDLFLKEPAAGHTDTLLDAALERASVYARAGASGFFVPGLRDTNLIKRLCEACPLPVNIMMTQQTVPTAQLAQLGVSRISYGPGPYRAFAAWLTEQAREVITLKSFLEPK